MTPSAPPAGVRLWIARESLADDAALAARIGALLTDDERERQARFRAAIPRRLDLVARGMVRIILSRLEPGIAPADWRFLRTENGRPVLSPSFAATGLQFNLAHTPGLVALAAGHAQQIGVDVEAAGKHVRLEVARRYFAGTEADALFALPPEQRAERFLRLWTLKESYLKATGQGVARDLAHASFAFERDAPLFEAAGDGAGWVFREYRPPDYLVALAYRGLSAASPPPLTWTELGATDF